MSKFSEADIASLRGSDLFDPVWYADAYPDVARSGMDPAEHYLWIGAKLGRRPLRPSAEPVVGTPPADVVRSTPQDATLDALFVDGTNGTSSTPYRVTRIANGLAAEGWRVRCARGDQLLDLMREDIVSRFVIFHRAPYWPPFTDFVEQLRAKGSIIVFDVDDLIFDETVIPHIDGFRFLPDDAKEGFLNGVRAYRDFILNADMCTSTTSYLVEEMRKLGKPAYRVRNAISSENIAFFERIDYKRTGRPTPFVIGYYSGTKTHQADFAVVAPALIQFMHENTDVVFRLVGEFDLADYPELAHWQHVHRPGDLPRVTRVGLMPHDAMIRDQFSCDLIIAPLEVGNPFCEAKSELKFFEAALAQAPVIASSTRTFAEASDFGRLAHLAATTEDWLAAFQDVYSNYSVALNRARHSFYHVRTGYSQRFAANEALDAYEHFDARRRGAPVSGDGISLPVSTAVAQIGVILPDFSGPSGGHRKIFSVCKELERAGQKVKLYFYTSRPTKLIKRDIDRLFCKLDAEVTIFTGEVDSHSHVICTQWKTTYDFRKVPFEGTVINFVQDFEPMFFAVGSDYMRALVSYQLGFDIICYGDWVAAKLKDELGVTAKSIPFTLNHHIYNLPAVEVERDIDILLFARPSQDRRCFDLIVDGLRELKVRNPSIRIGLFGEDDYEDTGFAFTAYGSISDLAQLAELYRRTRVGICFSSTNPSQLGYEMIACGVALVDVSIKFAELNFGGAEFVTYCSGLPESLAEVCNRLLADPAQLERRRKAGCEFVRLMPDDEELGKAFMRAASISS